MQTGHSNAFGIFFFTEKTYNAIIVSELQTVLHVRFDALEVNQNVIEVSNEEEEHGHALPSWNCVAMAWGGANELKVSLRCCQIFLVAGLLAHRG